MKIKQKERERDREVGHKVILQGLKKETKSVPWCVSEYWNVIPIQLTKSITEY